MDLYKKKILFISARFPYPLHKGDQLVLYNNIRIIHEEYEITLITMYDEESELKHLKKLEHFCKNIITIKRSNIESYLNMLFSPFLLQPLQVAYYKSQKFKETLDHLLKVQSFDIIHVYSLRMASYLKENNCFKILSLIDSMGLNMSRRVAKETGIKKLIFSYEAFQIKKYEKDMVCNYDKTIVVSKIDKNYINIDDIDVIPIGIDTKKIKNDRISNRIIFSGNMGYFPNENAVNWFLSNCFKKIKNCVPNVEFIVVGKNPSKKIKKFHDGKNIFIKGFVLSMTDALRHSSISIAPMQAGSGMQIKVLEAMSIGLPIVATDYGKGDISVEHKKNIVIANDPIEFADECIKLLKYKKNRDFIRKNAYEFIKLNHSWKKIKDKYLSIYNSKV